MLLLRPAPALESSAGHLGCQVSTTVLFVPEDLIAAFGNLNARTLEECISVAQSFPSALAAELKWTVEQVQAATEELYVQLEGFVPAEYITTIAQTRSFGAIPPDRIG